MFTSPTPPPTPASACTPGAGGIPDSILGNITCGTWAKTAPHAIWAWLATHYVHAAVAVLLLVAVRVGWAVLRRRVWNRHAANAVWLEIVPPVSATPAATVHLWRLLATLLPAPRPWSLRPARLVWEVQATPTGMRCGLWIPPGINPSAVVRVLERGWTGTRAHASPPPKIRPNQPTAGQALAVTQPEWLPLVDDDPARTTWRSGATVSVQDDLLRAVYDGLAAAGRTGGGLLQVIVGRAPGRRVAALRRATVDPSRARRQGASRVAGLLAMGLRAVLIGVLDVITPGPSTPSTGDHRVNSYDAELAREARTKFAASPHLIVAVRAFGLGPTSAAARAAAADITSGYGLVSTHFTRRRIRRPYQVAMTRWVTAEAMTLVTVGEVAAVAGLPAEPSTFGLPAAAARHRLLAGDNWRQHPTRRTPPAAKPPHPHPHPRPSSRRGPASRPAAGWPRVTPSPADDSSTIEEGETP